MSFCEDVNEVIKIVDEAFHELGLAPILENSNFMMDETLKSENYLRVKSLPLEGSIDFTLQIMKDGVIIGLDRVEEAFSLSIDSIHKNVNFLRTLIKEIMTCYCFVETIGPHKTNIVLFNRDGMCIKTLKYKEGFWKKGISHSKLYFPFCSS